VNSAQTHTHTHTLYVCGCTKIIFIVNFINISPQKLSVLSSHSLSHYLSLSLSLSLSTMLLCTSLSQGAFYLIKYTKGPQPPPPSLFGSFTSRYFPIVYTHTHTQSSRKFNITRARFAEHVQQTPPRAHRNYIRYRLSTVYIYYGGACVPAHRIFGTRRLDGIPSAAPPMCHGISLFFFLMLY